MFGSCTEVATISHKILLNLSKASNSLPHFYKFKRISSHFYLRVMDKQTQFTLFFNLTEEV
jgi:hypothetical protein